MLAAEFWVFYCNNLHMFVILLFLYFKTKHKVLGVVETFSFTEICGAVVSGAGSAPPPARTPLQCPEWSIIIPPC